MSAFNSAISSCWRPRLEVVCFFKSGRRTPRFFMRAMRLLRDRGRMPQDSANSLRVLPARCAERYATINSRAPAKTLFERVFLVVVSVPVVITSVFIRITLSNFWKTVVKRTFLFFALVLPYIFNLSMTFVESNRRPRKYTKKVFLFSVSLCRHLPYGIQKNVFLFAFPENTPGDMARGYGGGICGGDMRRGYACRNKNARRRRAEIWKNDMAGD